MPATSGESLEAGKADNLGYILNSEAGKKGLSLSSETFFNRVLQAAALLLGDVAAISFSAGLAVIVRVYLLPAFSPFATPVLSQSTILKLWWFPIAAVVCYAYEGLYTRRLPFWREFERLTVAGILAFGLTLALVTLAKLGGEVSRTLLILTWVISLPTIPIVRYNLKSFFHRVGIFTCPVLVLGASKTGKMLAATLEKEKTLGFKIAGFLDDNKNPGALAVKGVEKKLHIIGGFTDVEDVMKKTGVRDLIIATPGLPGHDMVRLINRLHMSARSILVVPDLFGAPLSGVEVDYFFSDKTLVLRFKNNLKNSFNVAIKNLSDIILGISIFISALPLLVIIGLAIKLDSRGSVFFIQKRLGKGGKVFNCYKFRTMVPDAEEILQKTLASDPAAQREWQSNFKLKNDPRVTRVGKILRKTSLDELGQIINVLRGEMSLVGPRPRPLYELEGQQGNDLFDLGLSVKPGMTGLWQVSGRSDLDFNDRIKLDAWYVQNWFPWLDIFLLLKTAGVVLKGRGAY